MIHKEQKSWGGDYFIDEAEILSEVGRAWNQKGDKVILKDVGVRSKVNAVSAANISGAF
ncbi:hypothetical protein [Leptospira santarosai]|uniref:hypothetical protein n=1 Tax=Leptospira santarosai TaxID=28183 RepID=UPI000319A40B|nr:hypothetical protein [Leptospira santarosai]